MFSDDEIQYLRTSFALTKPVGAKAADKFFANLFEAAPELQGFFSTTKAPPKSMLWATVGLIVDNLEDLESLDVPIKSLGTRHVALGATFKSYGIFADVIIGTIAEISGDEWTNDHEIAWEKALGFVVDKMLEGAQAAENAA